MKLTQLIPEFLVEDMPKTMAFYKDILGFETEIVFPEKEPIFAQIGKDGVHIMLYVRNEFEKEISKLKHVSMGGSTLMYIKAEKVEELYQKIKDMVTVIQELHKTAYGNLEFTIEDCNGYFLCFSEKQ
jgi:uncharacterized glyoxalase superfamily protein PhnB